MLTKSFTPKRWLHRLSRAEISDRLKEVGRAFIEAHGKRKRRWVAAWEVKGAWEHGNSVLNDLWVLKRQNLLYYDQGHFSPRIGPRLPRSEEHELTVEQMGLVREMLLRRGGRCLYFIVNSGYFADDHKTKWLLRSSSSDEKGRWPKSMNFKTAVVKPLIRKGIIEPNGCTYGGFHWNAEFRVNPYRLYSIRGLPAVLRKFIREEQAVPA